MKTFELIEILLKYPKDTEIKIFVNDSDLEECKKHGNFEAGDPSNDISCLYAFNLLNDYCYDDKEKVIAFDVWGRDNFVDAQKQALLHPNTFHAPALSEVKKLPLKTHVQVSTGKERFWVVIKEQYSDGNYVGEITNNLINTDLHGLACNDSIEFEPKHILNILSE